MMRRRAREVHSRPETPRVPPAAEPETHDQDTADRFERDEAADLAEELLAAAPTNARLIETEQVLQDIEAQEAEREALAVAESASGEAESEPLGPEEDLEAPVDDVVRLRLEGRLGGDLGLAGHAELELPPGPRAGEFVCAGCGLTRLRTQLADPVLHLCRDCADTRGRQSAEGP